ncbi:MAG TPA: hypothetical protein VHG28_15210 [Longimicrobiaceae bacterium]|nr:hypothetical protein [Longimicrobiaceae bacterium]
MRLFVLVPLALAALPVLAAAQRPGETLTTRLVPPARVGAFRLAAQGQLEGRVGGQLQYRTPDGAEITANLHPLPPLSSCAAACDSVTVDLAATALAASPARLAHGADIDSVAVERNEVVGAPYAGGVAYGRRLVVGWLSEGARMRVDLSLFALGSYVAEVRSTFRPGPERDSLAVRFGREFVEALGRSAGEATACASGPADPEVIRVTESSRLGIDSLRRRVEPVLAGFGFRLDPAVKDPDAWRSAPLEGWPTGVDYGPWARQASPGFVVGVRLEESAGTARITVTAEARCAPVSPGEDARSLELALELMTARAVLAQVEGKRAPR